MYTCIYATFSLMIVDSEFFSTRVFNKNKYLTSVARYEWVILVLENK
jgi:hypothetical protein